MVHEASAPGARVRPKPYRVAIIDDHPVFRLGLRFLLEGDPSVSVIGEGSRAGDVRKLAEQRPDLVLLDLMLQDGNGIDAIREVREISPDTRVLVVSMLDEVLYAERCVRAGACGYLAKNDAPGTLASALARVLSGDIHLGEAVLRQIARRVAGGGTVNSPVSSLSDRELEVFQLIGQGHGAGAIARMLHVSRKTVETHQAKLKRKLGASTSSDLLRMALEWQRGLAQNGEVVPLPVRSATAVCAK